MNAQLYHFSPNFYHLAMHKARSQLVLYVFHVCLSVYIYIDIYIYWSVHPLQYCSGFQGSHLIGLLWSCELALAQ